MKFAYAIIGFLYILQSATKLFQAALITDGSASYAVFIYNCHNYPRLNTWNDGNIGWADTSSLYKNGRLYCSDYSCNNNILYRLDRSKCN